MNPPTPPETGNPAENDEEPSVPVFEAEIGQPDESTSAHAALSSTLETSDPEVAEWVLDALDRRKRGVMGKKEKPALHTVALDAVPASPLLEDISVVSPS
jgi:mitogen-activated protein kinase kinase